MKVVWITWEKQRRNEGICSALNWPLFEIIVNKPRMIRYIFSIIKTVKIIMQERPDIVAAQNPSIVLAMLTILLRSIFRYKVIIDAHNSGIFPAEGESFFLNAISSWLQRSANLTIVTNMFLQKVVESKGGRAFVLPDNLPQLVPQTSYPLDGEVNIAFICTFKPDEPYLEVIKAATLINHDIQIYVTGNFMEEIDLNYIPPNIKFLGYLPDNQFEALLSSSDFIMDLTVREGCLVCGAYEGVSLSKPLILSDTAALRSYFNEGCVYVKPFAESIAIGIKEAIQDKENLHQGIRNLKLRLDRSWKLIANNLLRKIESLN